MDISWLDYESHLLGVAFLFLVVVFRGSLMVNFINGMADGIRDNTDTILAAVQNLMSAIVEFALSALQELVRNIPIVGDELVEGLEDAKSLVRETLNREGMKKIGSDAAKAAAEGIESANKEVKTAGSGLGTSAKTGLSSILGDFGSLGTDFGTDFSSLLGGTNDLASTAGSNLGTSATNGLDSVLTDFSSLGTDFGMGFSSSLGDTNSLASSAASGLGETASDGLNIDFSNIGEFSGDTYVSGLLGTKEDVKESASSLTSTATDNFKVANSKFKKSGSTNGTNYTLGISSEKTRATNAGNQIAVSGAKGSNSKINDFRNAGINSGKGFAYGLYDTQSEVTSAASQLASAALEAMNTTLDINSPSKEFYKSGMHSDKGFALGLNDYIGVVTDASENVGEQAKNSLQKSMLKVSDALMSDLDVDPTIRPVMDLSNITNGAEEINGLFGQKTFSVGNISGQISSRSVDALADIVAEMQKNNNRGSSDIVNTLSELRGDIAYLGNAISKMQIKMDTGALVGSMVAPMDAALGRKMIHKGRGN